MIDTAEIIENAACALRAGGVIAYPTEYCFGLGCDPNNVEAVQRLLAIKQRKAEQGLIVIAANIEQAECYVDVECSPLLTEIRASWPGPNTWILPARETVSTWVKGKHAGVAVRVTANIISQQLCQAFGGAIVSTSANRHGQDALLEASSVETEMGSELDFIVKKPVDGAKAASTIRDGITGQKLR